MDNLAGQVGTSVVSLINDYDTIAHNIANINTTGFKRKINAFNRILENQISKENDDGLAASKISLKDSTDFTQGSLERTGRSMDIAINGKGFFVIETPEGNLYSRSGIFEINKQGQLIDLEGRIVAGIDGPIVVPNDISSLQINIAQDGLVSAEGVELGTLRVVDFGLDEVSLKPVGLNCFEAPQELIPLPAQDFKLVQSFREKSNVNVVEELVKLMAVGRLYESNMSLILKKRDNVKALLEVAKGA